MQLLKLPALPGALSSARASAQVFADPKSQALLRYMEKIAPSEAGVLIVGETGTGKELVARHLHNLSRRRQGPFVAVNCGAFSENLVEAELFGHEKGAFTGALSARPGWFEEANGGTLLLDEIGDLPLPIQVKLLRVLQEREVVRLGSRKAIPIDVRVLAATNVRLENALWAGQFREDLYYRLNVVNLELHALRERPGDILPLAQHFMAEYGERLGHQGVDLEPSAQQRLLAYSWPGNIRELENVIHHALLMTRGSVIRGEDLQLANPHAGDTVRSTGQAPAATLPRPSPGLHSGNTDTLLSNAFRQLFEEQAGDLHEKVEATLLREAYRFCHRNQVHTANLLGLSRNITRAHLIRIGELVVNKRRPSQSPGDDAVATLSI